MLTTVLQRTPKRATAATHRLQCPLYDGHGNTIATLARNGTGYSIANQKRYDVWGKVRSDSSAGSSGQILNPTQKYCGNLGHKYDATSGLTYMRARYYEAETGRFISEDPARNGINWFAYCNNCPTIYVDESGREYVDAEARKKQLIQIWGGLALVVVGAGLAGISAAVVALSDFIFLLSWLGEEAKGKDDRDYWSKLGENVALSTASAVLVGGAMLMAEKEMANERGQSFSILAKGLGLVNLHGGFLLTFMSIMDL